MKVRTDLARDKQLMIFWLKEPWSFGVPGRVCPSASCSVT